MRKGTIALGKFSVKHPTKEVIDVNPEKYTDAVFRYYKFNVMASSPYILWEMFCYRFKKKVFYAMLY